MDNLYRFLDVLGSNLVLEGEPKPPLGRFLVTFLLKKREGSEKKKGGDDIVINLAVGWKFSHGNFCSENESCIPFNDVRWSRKVVG